jgi:hypothetical protein
MSEEGHDISCVANVMRITPSGKFQGLTVRSWLLSMVEMKINPRWIVTMAYQRTIHGKSRSEDHI